MMVNNISHTTYGGYEDTCNAEITYINAYIKEVYNRIYPLHDVMMQDYLEYSLLGYGKRYRPLLCLLFSTYFGLAWKDVIPFAVGIEMIHTYSLIHDDLPSLDNASVRRGKSSHHVQFGESYAILAGDALLTDAFYVMSLAQVPSEYILKAIREISLASGSHGMIAGQMLDIMGKGSGKSIAKMHGLKTGAMLQASCTVGAILAGADEEEREATALFGHSFGILFQVVDDILDEIGTTSLLGKPAGTDKTLGKTTFVTEYGIEEARTHAMHYYTEVKQRLNTLHAIRGGGCEESLSKIRLCVDSVYKKIG